MIIGFYFDLKKINLFLVLDYVVQVWSSDYRNNIVLQPVH